jgi:solute carrier family 25 2-oxodicarboxylate transporter 21
VVDSNMAGGKRKATPVDTLPPIAGGAVVTSIVMYPADVVRALCMSNPGTGAGAALRGFLDTHGVMGFVKQGLVAEVTRASISRAIKFFMQPIVHKAMYGTPETKGTPLSKGIAGAVGTVPEVIAISPLENIKLAAQLDKDGRFKGSADIAKHILKTRGFGGLMIGYAGMQVRQCLWTGGFFLTLDVYKGAVGSVVSNKLAQDVIAGFAAGASGTALNCWTDVCRSVVQKKALAETFDPAIPRPSMMEPLNPGPFFATAGEIMSARGFAGLYSGVGPKMVHLGGSGAILAVLMPRFKSMWFDMMGLE